MKQTLSRMIAFLFIGILLLAAGCSRQDAADFSVPSPAVSADATPSSEPTPEPTPKPTPEPTPEPEPGTFGELLRGTFAQKGSEPVAAAKYYRNENVLITMRDYLQEDLAYYVADIYIRDITNFRTAFSGGKFHSKSVPTDEQAQKNNAILAISGDFYNLKDKGLVIRNGEVYRTELSDWDVCVLFRDGTLKTYSPDEAASQLDTILASDPWQSWCFGPQLVTEGELVTEFNTTVARANPRTALGYYSPGHYCFVVVDGRQGSYSRGLTMDGLAQLMYDLGCTEAYNLDGGQTSMMAFYGKTYNQPYNGGRGVSDILYISETME